MPLPSARVRFFVLALCLASAAAADDYQVKRDQGRQFFQQKKYDEAIAAYQAAIQLKPRDWEAYNELAATYGTAGRYNEAVDEETQALALSPRNATVLTERGYYYEALGRTDEAMADFTEALKHREIPGARFHRARINHDRGRYADALADLDKVIRFKPAPPPIAWAERGDVYFAMGKYPEAIADYERYLPTVTYDVREGRAGFAYVKLGQPDRARALAARLIDVDPRMAAFFGGDHALDMFDFDARRAATAESVAAAKDAETKGQWDRAFREWMRAYGHMLGYTKDDQAQANGVEQGILRSYLKLAAKPEIPEAARRFKVQAAAAVREKNYAQAEDLFRKANRVAPYDGESCFNRALILAELNRKPEAIHDMKIYLLLDPHAPDARAAQDKIYEWGG